MKGIVAFAAIALGYSLFYYMVVLFRQYDSGSPADTKGIPFLIILGDPGQDWRSNYQSAGYATPPLKW